MRSKILILILAATLTIPAMAAAWSGKGAWEPDTSRDRLEGWMYNTSDTQAVVIPAPVDPVRKVYFNAIMGQEFNYIPPVGSTINPNLDTAKTSHSTYPYHARAMLGVWKDCNNDGYIGLGDNALLEYRQELLSSKIICPVETIPGTIPLNWFPPHNDGIWIHEFHSIGYDGRSPASPPSADVNIWNINDFESRVWGDDGYPGGPPSGTCYTTGHPPGSFHTVGGLTNLSDCYASGRIDQNGSRLLGASTWGTIKSTKNPWGNEQDGSYAYVWDCNAHVVTTPFVGSIEVSVYRPKVPTTSPTGSPAGTANHTGSGLSPGCSPHYQGNRTNPGQSVAHAPYTTENDQVNNQVALKIQPDFVLQYTERARTGLPVLGRGTPDDLGTGQLIYGGGMWQDPSVRAASRNPFVDRTFIAPQTVTVMSFYASISAGAISAYKLDLPKGPTTTAKYGFEACAASAGVVGAPAKNEWACDPTKWYPNGPSSIPREVLLGPGPDGDGVLIGRYVGETYNMRDIDCYDESVVAVRDAGVHYGRLTNTFCQR